MPSTSWSCDIFNIPFPFIDTLSVLLPARLPAATLFQLDRLTGWRQRIPIPRENATHTNISLCSSSPFFNFISFSLSYRYHVKKIAKEKWRRMKWDAGEWENRHHWSSNTKFFFMFSFKFPNVHAIWSGKHLPFVCISHFTAAAALVSTLFPLNEYVHSVLMLLRRIEVFRGALLPHPEQNWLNRGR